MSIPPDLTVETVRPIAAYHPTVWGNHFLIFASDFKKNNDDSTSDGEEYAALREEVRRRIIATGDKLQDKLQLIDAVQRLGVGYQFEKEIDDELMEIKSHDLNKDRYSDDLYIVSVRFRLLRQRGFKVSCDVFKKFTDNQGKFKESLIKDVKGMLSLYEAAYLAIRGEDILDEAIIFTTTHLKSMVPHVNPNLAEQIHHALKLPLRKSVPRLEARYFLDIYSEDDSRDKTLLKLAKLDFNMVQAVHQKELSDMSRWWGDLDIPTMLPYARDRLVEMYFLMLVGVYWEPKYTFGRIMVTKIACMESLIDDTFDAYGTFEELALFTNAVRRWDIEAVDTLPEYMRFIYKTLLDIFNEAEEELNREGRSHGIPYTKQSFQELVEMYYLQARWLHEGHNPSMEEYKAVALRSFALIPVITGSFLDMTDLATVDVFEWVVSNPKVVLVSENISRLLDDIGTHKFEQKREHSPSAVECYMKQHGATEEEAEKALSLEICEGWKDLNEELLHPTAVPLPLLERILYLTQMSEFTYADGGDRYTNPCRMRAQVACLLKDPVLL